MADQITVPTFEQIEVMLTKLATNYSNLASTFYDVFYNTIPMDVTLQMYNEEGVLETFIIPNRAKDKGNILEGEGSPLNNIEAGKGYIYQDLENGDLYIKLTATGSAGWTKFITEEILQNLVIEDVGDPNERFASRKGTLYIDRENAELYMKSTTEGNTGWIIISANIGNLADRDLDNLTEEGESHFANPNLDNLSAAGEAKFEAKEDAANKVTEISGTSTDVKFPTAKAVYDFVGTSIANFADKDFNNITAEAEARFIGNNKLNNGVIEAPELLKRTGTDNSIILSAGNKFLCTIGLNSNNTYKNKVITVAQDIVWAIPSLLSAKGLIFYNYTGENTGDLRIPDDMIYYISNQEPSIPFRSWSNAVWYKPSDNTYHVLKEESGSWSWTLSLGMAEIGRWSTNSSGVLQTLEAYKPIRLVNYIEVEHVVVETGGTEDNWYRLYKDGWIEAGGYGSGNSEITFNREFKTANYTFVASGVTSYTKAADKVTVVASGNFDWMAKGQVA